MECRRSKSHEVRAATWNVSSMVCRSGEVVDVLHRRKIDFCCAHETGWKGEVRGCMIILVEYTSSYGRAVITGLLVLMCLLLRDGLTVLSMCSESMSGSCR